MTDSATGNGVPPELAVPRKAPDRNLALELVRVTEAAAMAAGRWVGRGDKNGGDGAAVDAMRALIGTVSMHGVVVIGEGEKDQAPMLYNGEEVGDGTGPRCDVAVDPIDGTTLMAKGMPNSVAVIAVAERGAMFDPSAVFYMDKIAVGAEAADAIDITVPIGENIRRVAKAKRGNPEDVTVCILDRPRHEQLVQEVRDAGARIQFISDGDVAGAISAARPGTGVDLLLGIGGTPEGIIAAAALRCMGGAMQARLWPRDDEERQKAIDAGHDLDRVLRHQRPREGRRHLLLCDRDHRRRTAARRALLPRFGADRVDRHAVEVGHDPAGRFAAPTRQAAGILRSGLRQTFLITPDPAKHLGAAMLVVTTDQIAGWEIQRVCGEVYGVALRADPAQGTDGEKSLTDTRAEVISRMLDQARTKGGNAVVGLRFDSSGAGAEGSELCAYGTAVVAVPVDEGARQTATALGYGQPQDQQPEQAQQYEPQYQQQYGAAVRPRPVPAAVRQGQQYGQQQYPGYGQQYPGYGQQQYPGCSSRASRGPQQYPQQGYPQQQ